MWIVWKSPADRSPSIEHTFFTWLRQYTYRISNFYEPVYAKPRVNVQNEVEDLYPSDEEYWEPEHVAVL